ncbi:DUF5810 domain-containing protein [Halapricum hydrolyticum]|uniref:DUF5810 domain-containing protein n=1 Tax=Halapricum hydrolyticum TaxID=2979991 RepID=A0AAE3LFX0_9EURY|nr:DUF5810 domain-containing protein [Halapricum hydrolyticum]MCU4719241.1 DUF5810 domain-containing protein [Halapricum hydrolyticum]MCU4728326.1 DUF5810 domain-containing protein [Halapricum hydrolyticum]
MAYRCPVCEEVQADAVHLADHLAFTAVIRGGDHESWLDEHVPDWGGDDPEGLAARLRDVDAVESIDHPIDEVRDSEVRAGEGVSRRPDAGQHALDSDSLDDEAREILARARELTRQTEDDERD